MGGLLSVNHLTGEQAMRLLILGATGGTGRALIRQARERGHEVTAFVRSPQKLGPLADRVTVRQGNPQSVAELRAVLPGHDAVVSALGPPGPGPTTILRAGAGSTVEAMRTVGPRRLIVVSAAVLFDDLGVLGALLRRTLLKNVAEDSAEMERIVMASGLDWTIARPPRLTNGPLTGRYCVENGHLPDRSATASISRADVAHFLLSELEHRAYIHHIVGITRGKRADMIRSLLLFAHVVSVLALFVGLGLEWLSLDALRRSTARLEALRWLRVSTVVPRFSGIALALTVASGFYLGARFGVLGDGWMRASYAALLLMAIVGGPVAHPPMRALRQAAQTPGDGVVSALRAAASHSILRLSLRVRVAFGLAVVYLMIGKPDAAASLLVMGLALVLTIATSVSKRQPQSTLAEGYR